MSATSVDRVLAGALCPRGGELELERSDGHRTGVDLRWWRGEPGGPVPIDCSALDVVGDGPVLDARCLTGRRLGLVPEQGRPVMGIDTCAEAVELGRSAGLSCRVADVHRYWPPMEFGTVLALGCAVGAAGRLDRLPALLARLAALVYPGGAVLVGGLDWRVSAARHGRFLDRQRRDGRYPGEVRLRLRHGTERTEWFDWLWVDRDALATAAETAGLRVVGVEAWRHRYVARLVRVVPSGRHHRRPA